MTITGRLKFLLLITLLLLSSCGGDDECIPADDFGGYDYSKKALISPIAPNVLTTADDLTAIAESNESMGNAPDIGSVRPGVSENEAYIGAWHQIYNKNKGSNVPFIVSKGSAVYVAAEGSVYMKDGSSVINLDINKDDIDSGFDDIQSAGITFDANESVIVNASGNIMIKDQDGNNNRYYKLKINDAIAYKVSRAKTGNSSNISSKYLAPNGLDPNTWKCNVGSKDFYSSNYDSSEGKYTCNFLNGDGCAPVSSENILSSYSDYGVGSVRDGNADGTGTIKPRARNLNYNLFDSNAAFTVCTSNYNGRSDISGSLPGEKIGWTDSDYPEDAISGVYFDQNAGCSAIANDKGLTKVASTVGGLVKFGIVRTAKGRAYMSNDDSYLIDKGGSNSLYRNDSPNATIEICAQPTFTLGDIAGKSTKRFLLFKSLSNDPLAHKGYHANRANLERNVRNGGWKVLFSGCNGLSAVADVVFSMDDDYAWNMNSYLSNPDNVYKLMADASNVNNIGGDYRSYDFDSQYLTDTDTSFQRDVKEVSGSSGYCGLSGYGSDSMKKWCGENIAYTMLTFKYSGGSKDDRDDMFANDPGLPSTLGARGVLLMNKDVYKMPWDGSSTHVMPKKGYVDPICNVSINGGTTIPVNMSSRGWRVYPKVFDINTSISINSTNTSHDSDEFMSYGNVLDTSAITEKKNKYGWCYERSPCKYGGKGCDDYKATKSTSGMNNSSCYEGDQEEFYFPVWKYNEDTGQGYYKYLQCNQNRHKDQEGKFYTKEFQNRNSDYQVLYYGKRGRTCGDEGVCSGEPSAKTAIYCNSKAKWRSYEQDSRTSTTTLSSGDYYVSGGPTISSPSKYIWKSGDNTPSISSHNLYCNPEKVKQCGVAMGFRVMSDKLHRCLKGYKKYCTEERYKDNAEKYCNIHSAIGDDLVKTTIGICVRRVISKDKSDGSVISTSNILRYSGSSAKKSPLLNNNIDSSEDTKYLNSSLIMGGKFDASDMTNRGSIADVPIASINGTVVNLELTSQSSCGVCVNDKNAIKNGILTSSNIKSGRSGSDALYGNLNVCKSNWLTSYQTDNINTISYSDESNSVPDLPNNDQQFQVSYTFIPVYAEYRCLDESDVPAGITSSNTDIFKSMHEISADPNDLDEPSGKLSPANMIIMPNEKDMQYTISAYIAGTGTDIFNGLKRFKDRTGAKIMFNNSPAKLSGAGLVFYIQQFKEGTFELDSAQSPKVVFKTKNLLREAYENDDPRLIKFDRYNQNGNGIVSPNVSGAVWAIVYDDINDPLSDGKYILFDIPNDPYTSEYENTTANASGSNVLGSNKGGYKIQLKKKISSSVVSSNDTFSSFAGAADSLFSKIVGSIYGNYDENSKICRKVIEFTDKESETKASVAPVAKTDNSKTTVVGNETGCDLFKIDGNDIKTSRISLTAQASNVSLKNKNIKYFCTYGKSISGKVCNYKYKHTFNAKNAKCATKVNLSNDASTSLTTSGLYNLNPTSVISFTDDSVKIINGFKNKNIPFYKSSTTTFFPVSVLAGRFIALDKSDPSNYRSVWNDRYYSTVYANGYLSTQYSTEKDSLEVQNQYGKRDMDCRVGYPNEQAGEEDHDGGTEHYKVWFNGNSFGGYAKGVYDEHDEERPFKGSYSYHCRTDASCCTDRLVYYKYDDAGVNQYFLGFARLCDCEDNVADHRTEISTLAGCDMRLASNPVKFYRNGSLVTGSGKYNSCPRDIKSVSSDSAIAFNDTAEKTSFTGVPNDVVLNNQNVQICFDTNGSDADAIDGDISVDYSMRNILDLSQNNSACPSLFGISATSEDSLKGVAYYDYQEGKIDNSWCSDSSCSSKNLLSSYNSEAQKRMTSKTSYSCHAMVCANSNDQSCGVRDCTGQGWWCNPFVNEVYSIKDARFPKKYGDCVVSGSDKYCDASNICDTSPSQTCEVYAINPNLKEYKNIHKCLYEDISYKISDNSVTTACWVKEGNTKSGVKSIYGNNDYVQASNGEYPIEAPKPFKEFKNCTMKENRIVTCTVVDRKFRATVTDGNEYKYTLAQVGSDIERTVIMSRTDFAGVGEDISSVMTKGMYVNDITCADVEVKKTIDKNACQLNTLNSAATVDTYLCNIQGNNVVVSLAEYNAGYISEKYCAGRLTCSDPTYNGVDVGKISTPSTKTDTETTTIPTTDNVSETKTTEICEYGSRDFKSGFIYKMFTAIILSVQYQALYYTLIALWVLAEGYKIFTGGDVPKGKDLIDKLIKFGVVFVLASPTGWDTYESLFVAGSVRMADGLSSIAISVITGSADASAVNVFSPLNELLGMITTGQFWLKIIAATFSLPYLTGVFLTLIMISCVVHFLVVLFNGLTRYFSAIIILGLYLSIGPIVALSYIFDKYKSYFDNWFKNVVRHVVEQFFLIIALVVMSKVGIALLKGILYKQICWKPVFVIPLGTLVSQLFGNIVNFNFDLPILSFWKYDDTADIINAIGALDPSDIVGNLTYSSGSINFALAFMIVVFNGVIRKMFDAITSYADGFGGNSTKNNNIVGDAVRSTAKLADSVIGSASSYVAKYGDKLKEDYKDKDGVGAFMARGFGSALSGQNAVGKKLKKMALGSQHSISATEGLSLAIGKYSSLPGQGIKHLTTHSKYDKEVAMNKEVNKYENKEGIKKGTAKEMKESKEATAFRQKVNSDLIDNSINSMVVRRASKEDNELLKKAIIQEMARKSGIDMKDAKDRKKDKDLDTLIKELKTHSGTLAKLDSSDVYKSFDKLAAERDGFGLSSIKRSRRNMDQIKKHFEKSMEIINKDIDDVHQEIKDIDAKEKELQEQEKQAQAKKDSQQP